MGVVELEFEEGGRRVGRGRLARGRASIRNDLELMGGVDGILDEVDIGMNI